MSNKITIRIGDKAFAATLADNATAAALKKLLPLSITIIDRMKKQPVSTTS